MEKTLKEKTTSALIWSFIDKFGQQIIYIITGIVLGRILSPTDYGLLGYLLFFLAISTVLIGSGYNRALLNKSEIRQEELNALLYYCVGMGLVIYLILFFCAPLISQFYNKPSLTLYSRVIFLTIIFNSVMIIPAATLTKRMDLNGLAKANIFSLLPASILAVIAAIMGYGVWALIIQNVAFAALKALFYMYYCKWEPTKFCDFKILKELYSFSSRVLLINLITATFNNVYYLLIGRFYPTSQLGFYTQANKYQDIPTSLIRETFRSVSMSLLSEVSQDKERLKRILSKMIKTVAFVGFPVMFGFILIAKPLFIVLITKKWLPSVPLFQILCIAGICVIFTSVIEESILSKGKSGNLLTLEIIKRSIFIVLILFTLKHGLQALAIGWAISWFISLILSIILSKKIVGYSLFHFIKDCFPYFAISSVLCGIAYLISLPIQNNFLYIGVCIIFVGSLYLLACKIFKLDAAMDVILSLLKKIKK
ncbi:MAG: lipopolysaccharide biosynthesis protein [Bacteroidales bacterium]|nr:lipopolysaccharide biosynthesis protein [Bacteroidales bacterium]